MFQVCKVTDTGDDMELVDVGFVEQVGEDDLLLPYAAWITFGEADGPRFLDLASTPKEAARLIWDAYKVASADRREAP